MKLLPVILFVFHFACAWSQSGPQRLDSMMKVLTGEKEDTNKVKTLSRISQYYYNVAPLKSFPYANQALALAEKLQWKKGIANLHNNLGLYIGDTGNNVLAREHYQLSYKINLEIGAKINQVNNLNNIGRSYQFEADYTKASDNFFKALSIAEELKDNDLIGLVGTNLTNCFSTQGDYTKAVKYAEMAFEHASLANNNPNIIKAQMQLGTLRGKMKDTAGAIAIMNQALEKAKVTNDRVNEANALQSLAILHFPDHRKQAVMMEEVKKIMDEINPTSPVAMVNNADLGDVYIHLAAEGPASQKAALMQKAEICLNTAKTLAERGQNNEYLADIQLMMSHLEEEKGNYKEALAYYKKSTAIDDSLFSQQKKNEIAGLEGKRNIAVKDNEIALNKLTLATQRKTQFALMAGLGFLVIIGGLLYWQSRNRKKTNTTLMVLNNQLDEANKVKARFFGILSHDLRSPIVNLVHFLHLQKDSPDLLNEEQQAAQRQKIGESAESLLNTMEAMLLWSKEQMEHFRPNIQMIAVADLFDYIQKFFGQTGNVSMRFDYLPGLMIPADENYLRTIMQNLTSNAIRALKNTPDASIEWKAKNENDKIILSITDNGPGIEPARAKTLFDESVVSNEKTGFGLHLIRDLAKAIQYKIAVQSEEGKGTTFILSNAA
jgi:signal transduction histidine kinase